MLDASKKSVRAKKGGPKNREGWKKTRQDAAAAAGPEKKPDPIQFLKSASNKSLHRKTGWQVKYTR